MTNEKLYEALGDMDERYIKEAKEYRRAKRPAWFKWGAAAACLCAAVLGILAIRHPGGAPGKTVEQPGSPDLVVNEVYNVTQVDMDIKISHYTDISADEWEAVLEAFERALGVSYEEVTKGLPSFCRLAAFYSVDVPAALKSEAYLPHDYVFEFLTENDGEVKLAICADEEPLRDCFFMCEDPKKSEINGVTALIYRVGDSFMVRFSHNAVNYDISTHELTLEELETLLTCITS